MLLASTNPPTQQLVRFYCDVALLQKAMAQSLSIVKRKKLARHCQVEIQNWADFIFALEICIRMIFFFKLG